MTVVAFSKFFTRWGEGHVPIIDRSLVDDININYIYFTVYLHASGRVALIKYKTCHMQNLFRLALYLIAKLFSLG